jgi:hypothetical protein
MASKRVDNSVVYETWLFIHSEAFLQVQLVHIAFSAMIKKYQIVYFQASPVTTNVATTALPIENIEFPAVTICGQGLVREIVQKVTYKYFR